MTQEEFMKAQVHQIEVDKWLQGERQGSDPGDAFVKQWIKDNAAQFRKDHPVDNV